MNESMMRIGEVAAHAGVRVSLLRYYEEVGLLAPAERVNGQRRYDPSRAWTTAHCSTTRPCLPASRD